MAPGDSLLGIVVVLLCVATFLRLHALDQYRLLISQDELSNIYDGYSLAETGNDRAGESHYGVVRGAP